MKSRRQSGYAIWMLPAVIFLALFFVYPLLGMITRSFGGEPLGLKHYVYIIEHPVYLRVLFNTFQIAANVSVICLVLGYPVAYALTTVSDRVFKLLMIFIVVPYFTSTLVRTYAWMVLLGNKGVLNQLLMNLGMIEQPLKLMYNLFGVLVGISYILLPYMILALYSVMKGLDTGLLRAARSLGASGFQAFRRIYLPLTLPGVGGGVLLVFLLTLGYFITPALMGSPRETMIAMVIESQVEVALNWGLASALGILLLLLTLIGFFIYDRLLGLEQLFEGKG